MQTNRTPHVEELIERNYPSLFHFAAQLCESPAQALVLTQRTFRLALDRSHNLPAPENWHAWLFTILFAKYLAERPRLQGI